MDRFQKLLTFFIFIEIIVFLCYCTPKSNNAFKLPTGKMFEVKKRNLDSLDTTTNAYTVKHKGSSSKKSLLLAYFKRGRPTLAVNVDDVPNKIVINNITELQKQNKTNFKSQILSFSKLKEKRKTIGTHFYNSSHVSTEIKTKCVISFDSESFDKAKKKFLASESYYLFHVHLKMNWLKNDSNHKNDDLFHWQYVLKNEQVLVQLPVDFDLLTYNLLVYDKEETTLEIQLVYNDTNCNQYDFTGTLQSVRLLLWNNLFNNDTTHYLCNRNFKNETARDVLYYITTIWVGYDLNCSEISSKQELYNFQIEKDHLPLVTPIFCYILSLQFVWIFALLDVQKNSIALKTHTGGKTLTAKDKRTQSAPSTIDQNTQTSKCKTDKTAACTKTIEQALGSTKDNTTQTTTLKDNKYCKAFLEMLGHKNINFPEIYVLEAEKTEDKGTTFSNSTDNNFPEIYVLAAEKTEDKSTTFSNSTVNNSTQTSEMDEIKIILCPEPLKTRCYLKDDRPYGIKQVVIKLFYDEWCSSKYLRCFNNPAVRLTFLLWVFILFPFGSYRTIGRYCILKKTYEDYLTVVRPSEPFIYLICKNKCKEEVMVVLDFIYAAIMPFFYIFFGCISYQIFLTQDQRICCCHSNYKDQMLIYNNKMINTRFTFRFYQFCNTVNKFFTKCSCTNCKKCSCKKCQTCCCLLFKCFCLFVYCFFPIIPFSNCNTCRCINDCSCESSIRNNENKTNSYTMAYTKTIKFLIMHLVCLGFPMSYVLCLRPIISTFTFLFRSFTYYVCVALPIRVHIFRYTFLVFITVTYFVKYFHEIVNMNSEVLRYVFFCEENKMQQDVKYVEERMFDFIYGKILFVRKKLYFWVLKMIVVFMYLFIIIETFITNRTSLTGTTFKDLLEFLLIIVGPYAISLFLKPNKENFLTNDNKAEIDEKYKLFYKTFFIDKKIQYDSESNNENSSESLMLNQTAAFSETPSGSGYTHQNRQINLEDMSINNERSAASFKETDTLIPREEKIKTVESETSC